MFYVLGHFAVYSLSLVKSEIHFFIYFKYFFSHLFSLLACLLFFLSAQYSAQKIIIMQFFIQLYSLIKIPEYPFPLLIAPLSWNIERHVSQDLSWNIKVERLFLYFFFFIFFWSIFFCYSDGRKKFQFVIWIALKYK